MNTMTVILIESATLRLSFGFDREINARIKTIPGWKFIPESKVWTVPLAELDRLISEFGGSVGIDLAIHPDVFMAAEGVPVEYAPARILTADQRLANFVKELRYAGIELVEVNGRLTGRGGCYCADPWQKLIDQRADQLRRLAPVTVVTKSVALPTTTVTLDDPRLTEFDRMAARQWDTWVKNQQEEDELIANAKRNRWAKKMQPELISE